ncbi:uncharacterized protein wu:fb55g09 [Betta splendens]|uniref:Uncharacterized protein wu:fb55g09 n=1 Tax=Betta splendens TaxID=158456 RepID=A0A6P7MMG3_BETSP|nr:uncharacterized protein wu:fb55g09 [Betta splendens]
MLSEKMCRRSVQQQQLQRHDAKEAPLRDVASRRKQGWSKSCRGRLQVRRTRGGGGGGPKGRNHQHPPRHRPRRVQRPTLSLRPVNVKGNVAKGMRAPKNTNQFLMHEKYQMLHMRSDSVGSDSGSGSDSDAELTDMDSYLGVLENARGALLDSPNPHGAATPPRRFLLLHEDGLRVQEDSMQYFPSEDDLLQTQNFMQRDFVEFCDILTS